MRVTLVLMIMCFMFASQAFSKGIYKRELLKTYPFLKGSEIAKCTLCHAGMPDLNEYGKDYRDYNYKFNDIEEVDSDKDGVPNLQELKNLTWPGDENSH